MPKTNLENRDLFSIMKCISKQLFVVFFNLSQKYNNNNNNNVIAYDNIEKSKY